MNQRHLPRVALLATFAVGLGCVIAPTAPTETPRPRSSGRGAAKPSPKATQTPAPSPKPTTTPTPAQTTKPAAATPTPGPPASQQQVASATSFPFTVVGQRWTYKLSLGAAIATLPGTLQVTTQSVSSNSSEVYSIFDVDTSKSPVGGSNAKPFHVERLQTLNRADGNPYAKLLSLLFDQTGQGVASSTAPVSTLEEVTVGGKAYKDAVRQKFDTTISSTTLKLDMYLTPAEGMVKEVAKGDKLPSGLLPPNPLLGSLDKLPFTLTLELDKLEKVDPQTLSSGTPAASGTPSASPTVPASGTPGQ